MKKAPQIARFPTRVCYPDATKSPYGGLLFSWLPKPNPTKPEREQADAPLTSLCLAYKIPIASVLQFGMGAIKNVILRKVAMNKVAKLTSAKIFVMAMQNKGVISLSGTVGGFTFVRTRKGSYVRSPRGTYKPATCNEALTRVYKRNKIINQPAKLVHDLVQHYAANFKQRDLWQVIVSRLRGCHSDDLPDLLATLEGLEINEKYNFSKILPFTAMQLTHEKGLLSISMESLNKLFFPERVRADSYLCEVCILLLDEDTQPIEVETIDTGWIDIHNRINQLETCFEIPESTRYGIVLAKVCGGAGGRALTGAGAMGVRVMKAGKI